MHLFILENVKGVSYEMDAQYSQFSINRRDPRFR